VKAARYGDIDVLEEGLRLNGPSTGFLEITINTNAGTVTGSVVGQDGPARNAVVVVVPDPTQRRRADLYKNVISGTDGTFRITGIAPGEYKVFSWIDVDAGAWQDPDFMKVYEELGKSIHIGEGSVASVEVTAIP